MLTDAPHPMPSQAAQVIHSFTDHKAGDFLSGVTADWAAQLQAIVPVILPWAIAYMIVMWGVDWVLDHNPWTAMPNPAGEVIFEDGDSAIVRHENGRMSSMRKVRG